MSIQQPKNILIAPLDWGMGHTTRCVPIVSYLQEQGHNPIVAGNATQLTFIKEAFHNNISTIPLDGYDITYSEWNKVAQAGLLFQLPRIIKSIKKEHAWLQQMSGELKLDGIVSDNRYGLYHLSIPSVIMTHQLHVMSGLGGGIDNLIQRMHYKYLGRFGATWIVDTEGAPGLGGELSHSERMPERYRYLGLLSRFAQDASPGFSEGEMRSSERWTSPRPSPHKQVWGTANEREVTNERCRGFLLVLLSGPEPQRSNLSRILWQQVLQYDGRVVFAEGSEAAEQPLDIPAHIRYYKRLGNDALLPLLLDADMVICRSGYSTIMDLVALGKKAILIPTPGQTEQEYLGGSLHERGMFFCAGQDGFDLTRALKEAAILPFTFVTAINAYDRYIPVADEWCSTL